MTQETPVQELFYEMIEKIKQRVTVKAVILFGSRARGDAHPHSDYDLVIIADFQEGYLQRLKWVIHLAPFISLNIFCYTPDEFENMFNSYHLTAIDSIGEGIVLFGEDFIQPYQIRYKELVRRGLKKLKCILIPPA